MRPNTNDRPKRKMTLVHRKKSVNSLEMKCLKVHHMNVTEGDELR